MLALGGFEVGDQEAQHVIRTPHQRRAGGLGLQRPARIVWRGDRIEWLLARGFSAWFFDEIEQGRVAWPRR